MATRKKAPAPRTKVRAGNAEINASDLKTLQYAWRTRELVLFLGAGVSIPYGLPSWKNLVLELLFDQAQKTRRLGGMWSHYRRAVASWMTDYFSYDPLVLARMVERHLPEDGFLERLREHLYEGYREPKTPTLLDGVCDLIARGRDGRGVDSVVTFNFDDLLEQKLAARRIRFRAVTGGERQTGGGLPIIHPHGFVPQKGAIVRENIVFTEPDYHRLTESVFHWGLSEIVERLRKRTVLFLGLSMSDPSLRRLLDASRNSKIPPHYQIQKRHEVRPDEMSNVTQDLDRRAREYARLTGASPDSVKAPDQLTEAIRAALAQADTYDHGVFESMGVKTIWVDGFEQIPDVLAAIANGAAAKAAGK